MSRDNCFYECEMCHTQVPYRELVGRLVRLKTLGRREVCRKCYAHELAGKNRAHVVERHRAQEEEENKNVVI